jgi:hypothetical protein
MGSFQVALGGSDSKASSYSLNAFGMKKPAALTSRVASACSTANCFPISGTWSRSVSSAVMPHAFPFCDNASIAARTLSWSRPVITAVPLPATTGKLVKSILGARSKPAIMDKLAEFFR